MKLLPSTEISKQSSMAPSAVVESSEVSLFAAHARICSGTRGVNLIIVPCPRTIDKEITRQACSLNI